MHSHSAPKLPVSLRTRLLAYGLLAFCVAMTLFGPQVSELLLQALGCPGNVGSHAADCQGMFRGPVAQRLSGWRSATSFVESGFMLLGRLWGLVAAWVVLVVLSLSSDRSGDPLRVIETRLPSQPPPSSSPPAPTQTRGQQMRAQQAEQLRVQMDEQRALRRQEQQARVSQQQAQQLGSLALVVLWWLLLGGFVSFCIAFGTPLLGALSADAVLDALACSELSRGASSPCGGGFGGFWAERLAPYRQPVIGALLAPFWLLTQFFDLLMFWLALILALGGVLTYRLGRSVWRARSGDALDPR